MSHLKRCRNLGVSLSFALGWALFLAPVAAQATISKEYQVKAVFLFNLAQFVTWPPSTFARADGLFCIGVLGKDPFGAFLDETIRGEKVGGHPLVVRRFGRFQDVKDCQVLFVSASEKGGLEAVLSGLKGRSILTVGDFEGFAKQGGIVRFLVEKNKVHLRINPGAAKEARLTLSSKLLRLAEIVRTGED